MIEVDGPVAPGEIQAAWKKEAPMAAPMGAMGLEKTTGSREDVSTRVGRLYHPSRKPAV